MNVVHEFLTAVLGNSPWDEIPRPLGIQILLPCPGHPLFSAALITNGFDAICADCRQPNCFEAELTETERQADRLLKNVRPTVDEDESEPDQQVDPDDVATLVTDVDSPSAKFVEIETQLERLTEKLNQLQSAVAQIPTEIPLDDRPWERMLKHLQATEEQSVDRSVIRPLIQRLILLVDLIDQQEHESDRPSDVTAVVRKNIVELLQVYGVEPIICNGTDLDGSRQRAITEKLTTDEDLDGTICHRIRTGFQRNSEIIRFEEVSVWRFQPAEEPAETETALQQVPAA